MFGYKYVLKMKFNEFEWQRVWQKFEDTKGVVIIHKSKKDRQHNGQKKKNKRTKSVLQNITRKTKDRAN
jgi:hypothetical protein